MDPPKRCEKDLCKKKLTLTSTACKCKKYFCASHHYEDQHECTFDYKEQQKKDLQKYMSTALIASKIEAI